MANKVNPDPNSFPPVPGTNVSEFDAAFLARKEKVGEHFCQLHDGRKLCYFKDVPEAGEEGTTLVIAMHGGCEGKYKFLLREPLEGVTFVSIDRPGYGQSTKAAPGYGFPDAAKDLVSLAESLGHKQFILTGHSIGGFWCQQLAAALPNNVRGIILWAPVVDFGSIRRTDAFVKAAGQPPAALHPKKGMCGCILRSAFTSFSKKSKVFDFKENVKDEMKHGPIGYKEYAQDPFWVSTTVASWCAFTDSDGILTDANMCLFAGTHGLKVGVRGHQDITQVKCPVYLFHGEKDVDLGTKYPGAVDYLKHCYPNIVVETLPDVGHICVVGPNQASRDRFLRAIGAMPPLATSE
mmetsp:Transcript_35556/g.89742  ORF Transcript_35556/g.89742 Transcript_35556/m.89742 type:complete len:350 (-) Transcript_35556:65-1114(-)